jgi:hypothetical protein
LGGTGESDIGRREVMSEGVFRRVAPRVWLYAPQFYWFGWKTLLPWYLGGDEYDRRTLALGWTVTGRVVIALSRASDEKIKALEAELAGLLEWKDE